MDRNDRAKRFGEWLGRLFGFVLMGCFSAILIALTIRVIQWLIF